MNPNIYLAYMCFLGKDVEVGRTAREFADSFAIASRLGLFRKLSWNDTFQSLVHRLSYEKQMRARMDYVLEAQMAWGRVSAQTFFDFLKKYGFKT